MPTAYSYIRFSSRKQADGDSLRRQTELARNFCEANKLTLSTVTYEDLGLSGWDGSNVADGKLGLFLQAIRHDKIKIGSLLLVEKIDRISRDETDRALTIFMDILRAGIKIVTLSPIREYTIENWGLTGRVEVSLLFALAREESTNKSDRLKAVWATRRKEGKSLGGNCPCWLRWNGKTNAYETIPEKVKTIQQIFEWASGGVGIFTIQRKLLAKAIPPISKPRGQTKPGQDPDDREPEWNHHFIWGLLKNRAVTGERILHQIIDGERTPQKSIKGYFPVIVDQNTFAIVQQGMKGRDKLNLTRGRGAKRKANIFQGMMFDARDGGTMTYCAARKGGGKDKYNFMVSANAVGGKNTSCYVAFPYEPLETHLLFVLQGVTASDLEPTTKPTKDELKGKRAQLATCIQSLKEIQEHIRQGKKAKTYLDLIDDLEQHKETLSREVESLEAMTDNGIEKAIDDIQILMDTFYQNYGSEVETQEIRERMRNRIHSIVERINVLFSTHKKTGLGKTGYAWNKRAVIDIVYRNGRTQRTCIEYQHGTTEFADSNKKISLANLPRNFEKTNKEATI